MRILVYGAGVLGCNLANNLHHAKKDVTLLARGAWAEQLIHNGLHSTAFSVLWVIYSACSHWHGRQGDQLDLFLSEARAGAGGGAWADDAGNDQKKEKAVYDTLLFDYVCRADSDHRAVEPRIGF